MNKIVLIGDIVSSREITNRALVQKKLVNILARLNKRKSRLESPYTITLGDEFQAVFKSADTLFYDAISILVALYPEKVRFSFGIGIIRTAINRKTAMGMDGPAFYNARAGIDSIKRTPDLFSVVGLNDSCAGLVEQGLRLISRVCRNWKKRRFEILLRLSEHWSVKKISRRLQISDKAVYKTIDAGALKVILQLFEEITHILNESLRSI